MSRLKSCPICGKSVEEISGFLGACLDCLRKGKGLKEIRERRRTWRSRLGLPQEVPKGGGLTCNLCVNNCQIPEGSLGFCGVRKNVEGRLFPGRDLGLYEFYLDPIPTNCVSSYFCPATTSTGYPAYTSEKGVEYGKKNLAVFFYGCNLDCFFCQNYDHKRLIFRVEARDGEDLLRDASRDDVTCICYFGGDPGPQAPFAISISKKILEENPGKIKRICWETNGIESEGVIREMGNLSLKSGGILKIDWKAWSPHVYEALTGINGERARRRLQENCKILDKLSKEREFPVLAVSTLVLPGYIDYEEVYGIASFLSSLDSEIPYVLLAFYPTYLARDLKCTSKDQMEEAIKAAKDAGLRKIYVGNYWLLRG